jgi:acetate kinase
VSGRGERNQRNAVVVSADDSRTAVLVVPTDEELEIAQQSRAVLGLV